MKGLCSCTCGDPCPLSKIGMEEKCTADDLRDLANKQQLRIVILEEQLKRELMKIERIIAAILPGDDTCL